ncbi:P-loop containing nucleoside triphosphate hydrolase protein, partial [Pisolithus marmoratus]
VMGPTGSGKSNFINKLTGSQEESRANGLKSCTQDIREFIVNLDGGKRYVFVDTPGFDDTYKSDREILRTIADWLEENCSLLHHKNRYRGDVKLTGVVYTHRISDNRMSGSVCKNLDLFGKLCGENAAQRVRLVTTMWDKQPANTTIWQNRASQLEGNFWKPLISLGARHERFNNTQKSAWNIVNGLVQARTPLVQGQSVDASVANALLIQEEMVVAEKELNETSAGKTLYSRLRQALLEQKHALKDLGDALAEKDPNAREQLRAERKKAEAEMQKLIEDVERMKIPFGRRIALFFGGKKTHSVRVCVVSHCQHVMTSGRHSARLK